MPHPPLTTSYWPADTSAPVLDTTIGGVLRAAAERAPDQPALVAGDPSPARRRQWTYDELLAEAERAAHALLARFQPGDPVAVWSGNRPEWVLLEFAAGLAGLTLVPVNPAYQADELATCSGTPARPGIFLVAEIPRQLAAGDPGPGARSAARAARGDPGSTSGTASARRVTAGALPEVDPASPAQILYTSGTTGRPKGAVLTHRGLTNNARLAAEAIGMRAGEAWVNPMPLFHIAAAGCSRSARAQTLGTHVLMPRFDPGLALELTETVPRRLVRRRADDADRAARSSRPRRSATCPACGTRVSGGATVPAELVRQVEGAFGVPFVITFAQTECAAARSRMTRLSDAAADRAETLGRPLPQTEVKITDTKTGETVPCGTVGEMCTRGYLVMDGYLGDLEATSAAIDRTGGCTPATWARWTPGATAASRAASRR